MMMKKLAIASAVALMSMSAAYAQQTPVTTTAEAADAAGLMTTLSNSLGNLFQSNATLVPIVGSSGTPDAYAIYTSANDGELKYVLDVNGTFRLPTDIELAATGAAVPPFYAKTPGTPAVASVAARLANPVDITALAGAVNLSAINGGINITGVNVGLTGIAGNVEATATALTSSTALAINGNSLSTTVIGAMNSSTLDIAKMTQNLSDMTNSTLNIAGLANQGAAPSITTQSFGPGQLGLATIGSTILDAAAATTQFDMDGLVSGTDTLASSMTDKLQNMNVFNMAVNMAPLVAGVNIAALADPNAFFLNPQTGVVNLSGLQVATTAIGAMNSSITRLGAKLSN